MKPRLSSVLLIAVAAVLTSLLAGCASPGVDTSSSAEPSYDGLIPLKGTQMRKVWVREGFDLTGYSKVMVVGAGIQYRPVKDVKGTSMRSNASEFPVSDRGKEMLEQIISEEFEKAFEGLERYELVEEDGADVLLVRGAFLDVVSRVPPDGPGRTDYYLSSVGQASFMLEMLDSDSGAVLIRAVDTRGMDTVGYTARSSSVSNSAEARRLMRAWAKIVVEALNEVTTLEAFTG